MEREEGKGRRGRKVEEEGEREGDVHKKQEAERLRSRLSRDV